MQEIQQEQQQAQEQEAQMEQMKGLPNLMKAPMMDPSKNPQLAEELGATEEGPSPPPQ